MKKKTTLLSALPLACAALYPLSLRCRRDHPAWAVLSQYRYAHRGLHDKENGIPENSMASFRRAVDHGFGAELDIHLTRDGRLAVIHDNSLLRTAGANVNVSDLTAGELAQYRLEGTDETIPFLEDVLELFQGRTPLIVELKVDDENAAALCQAACDLLDQYQVDYCIESFHPLAVHWLAKNRPDICRGQLSQDFLHGDTAGAGPAADFILTNLLTNFLAVPDFIAYNHLHRDAPSLKLAKKLWGVREVSWTIRSPEAMEACEGDGCLVIFEKFVPSPRREEDTAWANAATSP